MTRRTEPEEFGYNGKGELCRPLSGDNSEKKTLPFVY